MHGADRVGEAFRQELGIDFGQTTPDGLISLEHAPCIGMCDQAPAALVNDVVVTSLSTDSAREIVRAVRTHGDLSRLVRRLGDGNNANPLVQSMVYNNIRARGPVVFAPLEPGAAVRRALAMSPMEVIRSIKASRLRGRGGAGFPTGLKWEFTRKSDGPTRYVVCNADEGEPGTFKDRVILTECPDLLLEGMTVAGYAIGAAEGIIYLRGEYAYLKTFLDKVIAARRKMGLLGKDVGFSRGFNFDVRVQMGAGAYVCGEESALLNSAEGWRGDPRNRPPFPAQKGYKGCPTAVNNVETFCCAARILHAGEGFFAEIGSKGSSGTKLLSISGDCTSPGVFEVPFGTTLKAVLEMAGGADAAAVCVGGPSGAFVPPSQFGRTICYDDLATGGAVVVFGPDRNLLDIVSEYLEFFVEESCGYCTSCRVGNVLLKERIERIRSGCGEAQDLSYLQDLGAAVKVASRCGLGQTSPNPVLTTLKNFRSLYEAAVAGKSDGFVRAFDVRAALLDGEAAAGRKSELFE
jgi:[NiFe] hydrogenase diaphorase moiety large subunit